MGRIAGTVPTGERVYSPEVRGFAASSLPTSCGADFPWDSAGRGFESLMIRTLDPFRGC